MHAGKTTTCLTRMTTELQSQKHICCDATAWVNRSVCISGGQFGAILQLSLSGKPPDIHADLCVESQLPNRQCVNNGVGSNTGKPCQLNIVPIVVTVAWCTLQLSAVQLTA